MANSNSEFISAWNEIFAFKVVESDLTKPTEKFVFNALISYLNLFNIDISALAEEKNGDLSFKIKFCKYIDHFYKISDKSNSFLYYDLIRPSPKKTAHMLKYLLNYWLYYNNMMKAEIVTLAEKEIQEYRRLVEARTKEEKKNEKVRIKAKSIEKSLKELNHALPKLNAEIENLQTLESTQVEKIREMSEIQRNGVSVLENLKRTGEDLKRGVVSQEEVQSLRANEASLQKAISEQEEIERFTLTNDQNRTETINKLQPTLDHIESIMETYPVERFSSAKEMKRKLAELMRKYDQQQAVNEKKSADIKTYSRKIEQLEEAIELKRIELQNVVTHLEYEIEEKRMNIVEEKKHNDFLTDELKKLEDDFTAELDVCKYILQLAEEFCGRVKFRRAKHKQ